MPMIDLSDTEITSDNKPNEKFVWMKNAAAEAASSNKTHTNLSIRREVQNKDSHKNARCKQVPYCETKPNLNCGML